MWASPVVQIVENLPAMQETWVQSLGQEDPQRRDWLPTPVFLPGESHRLRTLLGSSAYGQKVLDTTEMPGPISFQFGMMKDGSEGGRQYKQ